MDPRQVTVPGTAPHLPPRARAVPIVRWAGGKTRMVPVLAGTAHAYLQVSRGRYVEPFLGGGAVALDLGIPGMILSDVCAPLVATYATITQDPDAVYAAYARLILRGWSEQAYYAIRTLPREVRLSAEASAARFLYLNAACYNGLYRENRKGEFNVPWGLRGKAQAAVRTPEDLRALAGALRSAVLVARDFEETVREARAGDFVFADPPYLGTFSTYSSGGFGLEDHQRLADSLRAARDRGAFVCATHSDAPEIREMYAWAALIPTTEARSVGARGDARGRVACLLIASDASAIAVAPA